MCVLNGMHSFGGVVDPEEGFVVPSRGVGSATRDTRGRRERERERKRVGVPVLPIQEHQVLKAILEERVSGWVIEQDRIAGQMVVPPVIAGNRGCCYAGGGEVGSTESFFPHHLRKRLPLLRRLLCVCLYASLCCASGLVANTLWVGGVAVVERRRRRGGGGVIGGWFGKFFWGGHGRHCCDSVAVESGGN